MDTGTMVVGFRLGHDVRRWSGTVLVTESGVTHRGSGPYGAPVRATHARAPVSTREEHPLPSQIAWLRKEYARYRRDGYLRPLIPPACVRLPVAEVPLHPEPWGEHAPRPSAPLLEAFIDARPADPEGPEGLGGPQGLEAAVGTFYRALGLPARPPRQLRRPGEPALPPRAATVLRALATGKPVVFPPRRGIGYTFTPRTAVIEIGDRRVHLDHQGALELQAALTAWLVHTRRTAQGPPPAVGPEEDHS
ncbi:hypothetical protein ABT354_13655 [Streptomyces sp. NPDC000594]|uniref:hypothetical protein n=1 Tax=Streptomyces sp. NPDC000594 TaxID=3154261 RepID=UPI0033296E34